MTANGTNPLCSTSNGSITFGATGGTGAFSYTVNGVAATSPYIATASGDYIIVATDANGCPKSTTVSIAIPSAIVLTANGTNPLCSTGNGSIAFGATGGTGAFSYTVNSAAATSPYTATASGVYTIVATDANGCPKSTTVSVAIPTVLGYTNTTTNVSCFGANNGSTIITPTGGTASYSILWNNGSTAFTRTGLAPNVIYTAVIKDANGCTANVNVSVTQPTVLSVATVKTNVPCYGGKGTGTASPAGGTAPYNYSWNTNPVQTSAVANLPVGTWTVAVTDAKGCTVSSSVTLTLQSCQGFTTVTQGGWGALCSGGNYGCYLVSNFASKFPTGLQIGSGTRLLKLTSAAAVQAFLASTSTARALNAGTLTNPTKTSYSNVLAGQTVALALSIGFDANPAFSPSTTSLGSLVVSSGVFAGKSVIELLTIANTFLGGGLLLIRLTKSIPLWMLSTETMIMEPPI